MWSENVQEIWCDMNIGIIIAVIIINIITIVIITYLCISMSLASIVDSLGAEGMAVILQTTFSNACSLIGFYLQSVKFDFSRVAVKKSSLAQVMILLWIKWSIISKISGLSDTAIWYAKLVVISEGVILLKFPKIYLLCYFGIIRLIMRGNGCVL